MKKYFKNLYLPAMFGASIEYYDLALYGYMAPVLVQVFFPALDKTTAYFLYFLFEFIAAIFQFIGASTFGSIGDKRGRRPAMYISMLGISVATFIICLLPTYKQVGIVATLLFMLLRILQRFFLGGEYNGGAIYCLEHESDSKKHGVISGLYCAFTVLGIILASLVALICNTMGTEYFRIAYAFSFFLMIITFKIRTSIKETPIYLKISQDRSHDKIKAQKPILKIIVVAVFFGVIYSIPTKVFNALLPISMNISNNEIMLLNTFTLFIYAGLLVFAGVISEKYSVKKMMTAVAFIAFILSYPLISTLGSGSWITIIGVKVIFMALTAFFIGPFHSWAQSLTSPNNRYKTISTSYTIGKCISTLIISLTFIAYEYFNDIKILGILLSLVSIITVRFIYERSVERKTKALPCNADTRHLHN